MLPTIEPQKQGLIPLYTATPFPKGSYNEKYWTYEIDRIHKRQTARLEKINIFEDLRAARRATKLNRQYALEAELAMDCDADDLPEPVFPPYPFTEADLSTAAELGKEFVEYVKAEMVRAKTMKEGEQQTEVTPMEQEKSGFQFIHNADVLANLQPVEWQIKDILVKNSLYYDFGDPGSFKTFIALDRLLCIAAGIDYHNHKVKQGTAFYVAGEGQQGLGRRIAAWHIAHKTNARDVPFFLAKTPTQLMNLLSLDEVRRAVDAMAKEYGAPAILHIDTLARNFGDGDENSTQDMNKVIQNIDVAFGNDFSRGLTHHTGHGNKDRARGSIALHGAADAAFRVAKTDHAQVSVICKKMKDAPSSPAMLFDVNEIKLLIGGQYDSTFVLTLAAEGEEAAAAGTNISNTYKVSGKMSKALKLLEKMFVEYEENLSKGGREGATPRVEIKDWQKACLEQKIYTRGTTFTRAIESMADRDLIVLDKTGTFVCTVSIYLKYKDNLDDFRANCAKLCQTVH